jgi:hypothetical protein
VVGEKALSSRISLALQGNVLGGGLFDITSELSFVTSSGVSFYNGSASVPVIMRIPGSEFKFRIKRAARMWSLKYFNTESGEWFDLVNVVGLDVPVIPYIRCIVADFVGLACSASFEVQHFMLSPPDDAIGMPYYRNVAFLSFPAMMGSVIGGVVVREVIPSTTLGSIIGSEGWALPGLLPRP